MRIKVVLIGLLSAVFAICVTTIPAQAEINYQNQSYRASFAATTTQKIGDVLRDFSVSDINSTTSVSAGIKFIHAVKDFFVGINDWLASHAGINLIGILKTIAHWFVLFIEWVARVIKSVI